MTNGEAGIAGYMPGSSFITTQLLFVPWIILNSSHDGPFLCATAPGWDPVGTPSIMLGQLNPL